MENNHEISPKSLGNQQAKDNNFDPQLQFPWWYIQQPEEISQTTQDKASHVSIQRDSIQLDTELPFLPIAPLLTSVNVLPEATLSDNEVYSIRELPVYFEGKGDVKGFKFTQLERSPHAYLYQIQNCGRPYYEIFERRVNTFYGNETYPSNEAFGVWATTTGILQKALEIFDALNYRRNEPCV